MPNVKTCLFTAELMGEDGSTGIYQGTALVLNDDYLECAMLPEGEREECLVSGVVLNLRAKPVTGGVQVGDAVVFFFTELTPLETFFLPDERTPELINEPRPRELLVLDGKTVVWRGQDMDEARATAMRVARKALGENPPEGEPPVKTGKSVYVVDAKTGRRLREFHSARLGVWKEPRPIVLEFPLGGDEGE